MAEASQRVASPLNRVSQMVAEILLRAASARGKRDCTTVNEAATPGIEAAGVLVVTTDASAVLYTPAGANRWL